MVLQIPYSQFFGLKCKIPNFGFTMEVYGGGGKPSSSSFTLRMDDYNLWTSVNVPDTYDR